MKTRKELEIQLEKDGYGRSLVKEVLSLTAQGRCDEREEATVVAAQNVKWDTCPVGGPFLVCLLDLLGEGGTKGLGRLTGDCRSQRLLPFEHLGSGRWQAGDGEVYMTALEGAMRHLSGDECLYHIVVSTSPPSGVVLVSSRDGKGEDIYVSSPDGRGYGNANIYDTWDGVLDDPWSIQIARIAIWALSKKWAHPRVGGVYVHFEGSVESWIGILSKVLPMARLEKEREEEKWDPIFDGEDQLTGFVEVPEGVLPIGGASRIKVGKIEQALLPNNGWQQMEDGTVVGLDSVLSYALKNQLDM